MNGEPRTDRPTPEVRNPGERPEHEESLCHLTVSPVIWAVWKRRLLGAVLVLGLLAGVALLAVAAGLVPVAARASGNGIGNLTRDSHVG